MRSKIRGILTCSRGLRYLSCSPLRHRGASAYMLLFIVFHSMLLSMLLSLPFQPFLPHFLLSLSSFTLFSDSSFIVFFLKNKKTFASFLLKKTFKREILGHF